MPLRRPALCCFETTQAITRGLPSTIYQQMRSWNISRILQSCLSRLFRLFHQRTLERSTCLISTGRHKTRLFPFSPLMTIWSKSTTSASRFWSRWRKTCIRSGLSASASPDMRRQILKMVSRRGGLIGEPMRSLISTRRWKQGIKRSLRSSPWKRSARTPWY